MNRYSIQQKIKTPITLFRGLVCRGYNFLPIDQSLKGSFVIEKEVSATDFRTAYINFAIELLPILNAASVVTQCVIHPLPMGSFCVYKRNNNPENIVLFHHARDIDPVGMSLEPEELNDIEKILSHTDSNAADRTGIEYLRQANRSSGPLFWLAMLVIAAEAFADEVTKTRVCECGRKTEYRTKDKDALKRILGEDLYNNLYAPSGQRLRHKLFHGGQINEEEASLIAEKVHKQILLTYLTNGYDLSSLREIISAPRNQSFEYSNSAVRFNGVPNILELERLEKKLELVDIPDDY